MKTYIGAGLGGASVKVAKVGETGVIPQTIKEPIEIDKGVEQVVNKIIPTIERIEGYEAVASIGMGVPGPVDTKNDKTILATNLPGFEGYPITFRIEEYFHVPTSLDNDVNIIGMGGALQGAREGEDIVYYVMISTGVGDALVVNQRVTAGRNGHAGKIANLTIDRNREKVNYLNVGAAENGASDTAITRKEKVTLDEDAVQHAGDVFDLTHKGNAKTLRIYDAAAYGLTVMSPQVAHAVDPEVSIVSGGAMKSKDVFFDRTESYFRNMIHKGMRTMVFMEAELSKPGTTDAVMLPMAYVKE